jgi:Excreted virulence factor EspC, type VII ESX diderm
MGNEIDVDPASLRQPATRFGAAAGDVGQVSQAVRDALGTIGEAARHPALASAADAFGSATGSALDSVAANARKLSGNLQGAASRYHVTDASEVPADMAQADHEVADLDAIDLP